MSSSLEDGTDALGSPRTEAQLDDEFERARARIDARRAMVVAAFAIVVHVVTGEVVFSKARWGAADEAYRWGVQVAHRVNVTLLCAITVPLALLATGARARYGSQRAVAGLVSLQALMVAAWLGINAQKLNGNVNVFVFLAVVVGALFRHTLVDLAVIFGVPTAVAIVGIASASSSHSIRLAALTNVTAATAFAVLVCYLGRSNARRQFVLSARLAENNAELEQSRAALASLNASLRERVDEQVREIVENADEIKRLNAVLRHSVVEQARQLRRMLGGVRSSARSEVSVGAVIDGRVELLSPLGAGGSSEVFLGYDRRSDHQVVVKVLRSTSAAPARSTLERFVSEAELAARVDHPAVVAPMHVGVSEGGRLYHLFEYVDGAVLSDAQKQCSFTANELLRLIAGVADALAAAHAKNVIHRDVKPSNILLSKKAPGVFVLDFGIAKLDAPHESHEALTAQGELLGTPLFMAPEQVIEPESVRPSADLYALGMVWLDLLQGIPRIEGLTRIAVALRRLRDPSPKLAQRYGYSDAVIALFDAMVSTDPTARPTAERVAALLHAEADRLGVERAPALIERLGCVAGLDRVRAATESSDSAPSEVLVSGR
ncbi:MAG: serine/threonine-protein kinase [Polyangiales bacterium]